MTLEMWQLAEHQLLSLFSIQHVYWTAKLPASLTTLFTHLLKIKTTTKIWGHSKSLLTDRSNCHELNLQCMSNLFVTLVLSMRHQYQLLFKSNLPTNYYAYKSDWHQILIHSQWYTKLPQSFKVPHVSSTNHLFKETSITVNRVLVNTSSCKLTAIKIILLIMSVTIAHSLFPFQVDGTAVTFTW